MGFTTIMRTFAIMFIVMGCSSGDTGKIEKGSAAIKEGSVAKVHYTLTVQGTEVDSSKDGEPLQLQVGLSQLIPGFEKALLGMKTGEKKSFDVSPEDGYGAVDPEAFKEIPRDRIAKGIKPEAGMTLYARGNNGENIPIRIAEVKADSVIADFNHPLAGKNLHFDVEIVDVQ